MKITLIITLSLCLAACSGGHSSAIDSLKRIQAATKTGVMLTRYQDLVTEATVEVDKVCKEGDKSEPCASMRIALLCYQNGAVDWRRAGPELADLQWRFAEIYMKNL